MMTQTAASAHPRGGSTLPGDLPLVSNASARFELVTRIVRHAQVEGSWGVRDLHKSQLIIFPQQLEEEFHVRPAIAPVLIDRGR